MLLNVSVESAIRFVHDNHAARNVKLKPLGYYGQSEIWAESMVTGEPIFMGVLEKES